MMVANVDACATLNGNWPQPTEAISIVPSLKSQCDGSEIDFRAIEYRLLANPAGLLTYTPSEHHGLPSSHSEGMAAG